MRPSDINSHPHLSYDGKISIVHNGIIENYAPLKAELIKEGVEFVSETDTEVLAQLIRKNYHGDLLDAVMESVKIVEGSYGLGVICEDEPDKIVAVRKDSPLIVGLGEDENFIASDIPAVLKHTRKFYLLNDNEFVVLKKDGVKIYDFNKKEIKHGVYTVTFDETAAQKAVLTTLCSKKFTSSRRL